MDFIELNRDYFYQLLIKHPRLCNQLYVWSYLKKNKDYLYNVLFFHEKKYSELFNFFMPNFLSYFLDDIEREAKVLSSLVIYFSTEIETCPSPDEMSNAFNLLSEYMDRNRNVYSTIECNLRILIELASLFDVLYSAFRDIKDRIEYMDLIDETHILEFITSDLNINFTNPSYLSNYMYFNVYLIDADYLMSFYYFIFSQYGIEANILEKIFNLFKIKVKNNEN